MKKTTDIRIQAAGSDETCCETSGSGLGANPESDLDLAGLAKALGHPARVAILRYLLQCGECVCGDIVGILPLAQSTVSQHLKVLKEAGLVRGTVEGPRVCYCADPVAVRRMQELTQALLPGASQSTAPSV